MNTYFSQLWGLKSARSHCQQIQCFVRAHFLIDGCVYGITLHSRRGKRVFLGLIYCQYKGIYPIHESSTSHDLSTSQRPHLLRPLSLCVFLQHVNFEAIHSVHSILSLAFHIHVLAYHRLKSSNLNII